MSHALAAPVGILESRRAPASPAREIHLRYLQERQNLNTAIAHVELHIADAKGFEKHNLELAQRAMNAALVHLLDAEHEAVEAQS